jgi:hypothetical protein
MNAKAVKLLRKFAKQNTSIDVEATKKIYQGFSPKRRAEFKDYMLKSLEISPS